MKSYLILFVGVVVLLCSGCQSTRVVLKKGQTNDVPVVTTNSVPQTAVAAVVRTELNPIPGGPEIRTTNLVQTTNIVFEVRTNWVRVITPQVAYTNVSLLPGIAEGVQVAGSVAPVPWAGTAAGLFGIVASGIFSIVNMRRRQQAQGEAQSWQETAGVLVDNVESVRKAALALPGYTREMDTKVVRGLEIAQRVAGVKDRVHDLVEERTEDTIPA